MNKIGDKAMPTHDFSFALENPLSALLNKPAHDFQRSDFVKIIEQRKIERITFHYTGLDGHLKELKFPIPDRHRAEVILAAGERADGSSLFKGMVDATLSDLYVVPDYKTAFLNPFDENSLDFICRYLTRDGKRAAFALDNILVNATAHFKRTTGLELHALGELEFYLIFDKEPNIFRLEKQQGYHESAPFIKGGLILDEIVHYITQITGAVKYSHSEVGYVDDLRSDLTEISGKSVEQLEVEFLPKPIDEMADAVMLGRWIIRNVAFQYGCLATFAPKIEKGIAGNGLHFHLELMKKGTNIMLDKSKRFSEPARRLVGGLCEYADTLTAFGNTVASSYLRLVPKQEAPTRIFWSDLNRSALIRVPLAWSDVKDLSKTINPQETSDINDFQSKQTVELRSPDGSALVHLLLAGVVMAVEWGLGDDRSLELAEKLYGAADISLDKKAMAAFPKLPSSCVESSGLLAKKRALYEKDGIFPASIIDYVIDLLKNEDDAGLSRKLSQLSGADFLREIRKVMHRDLHRN
ncbi:MAG: glutamine synthetase beta-grasp domain-containing protein [Candidatus Aminicenantes bacterium]|jgi:glutamine synthetase